jgi:hypothetical protein
MKTRVPQFGLWLLVAAMFGWFASSSLGSVVVTTAPSVGPPPISSSYGGYFSEVLSDLSTDTSPTPYPVSLPYAYSTAPSNLHWGDMTVDNSGRSVWLGEIVSDTSSPFYGEKGTAFYVNLKVVGDGVHKFSANDIVFTVTSTDPAHSLNASGSLSGLTYGVDPIIAASYGPDGVLHTGDDVIYNRRNPAPSNTPVDYILYAGVAVGYDATGVGLGAVESYVDSTAPYNLTIVYSVNDGTGVYESSQTRMVTPEPATLTLLAIGGLALIRRRRKQ